MMRREEITQFKIKKLLSDQDFYDLPIFLSMLRKIHGAKRVSVCEDVGISVSKLFQLEKGKTQSQISDSEIRILSNYYGIPDEVLRIKSDIYFNSKSTTKKRRKVANV